MEIEIEIDVDDQDDQLGTDLWHLKGSIDDLGKRVIITVGTLACLRIDCFTMSMVFVQSRNK